MLFKNPRKAGTFHSATRLKKSRRFHLSCIWDLLIHPPPPRPNLQSFQPLHLLWWFGPSISSMTIWRRAIARPAVVALETAPGLLEILQQCSYLKLAVLEVQSDCRCGSDSAWIGRPVPLESTAFSVSIYGGAKSLQGDVQPVNELSVCGFCDIDPKGSSCRGQESPPWTQIWP